MPQSESLVWSGIATPMSATLDPRCRRGRRFLAVGVAFAMAAIAVRSPAQTPVSRVDVASAVDTTLADVRDIVRLVRTYLTRIDTSEATRGMWRSTGALDRRVGDLGRFFAYFGNPAAVAGVVSAGPGDSVYVVKVLHASVDSVRARIHPWALQRLYAVRAPGTRFGWQLSPPLPRLTSDWVARGVGRITFHYAPGQRIDSTRARRAARFVDSVATLFAMKAPEHIDYYVTASPDEYFRAIGLDFMILPSGPAAYGGGAGGNAVPEVGLVFAGDPRQGEAYLHELAHAVLGRGFGGPLLAEGIPTWLGGSRGRSLGEVFQRLATYQSTHPQVTLDALVRGDVGWGVPENDARYATGALFVDAVFRRGGVAALRALPTMPTEPAAVLSQMRQRLGLDVSDGALDRWWREYARARSTPG